MELSGNTSVLTPNQRGAGSTPSPSRFLRGSEWRRWDLHIHTPHSALNNGFGDDFVAYAKALFEAAIEKHIAVIGVTDYFLVDGYRELRDIQRDQSRLEDLLGSEKARQALGILLLPNIELRLRDTIRVGESDARINMHVIFAEDVDPNYIEENFLHRLDFTSQSAPDAEDERMALTRPNLEALGRRLKEDHMRFRSMSDIEVGMTQAVVSHEQMTERLKGKRAFEKRHLILLAADEDLSKVSWDGQGHLTRKLLVQKAHMFFSANAGTREFGLGHKHPSPEAFIEEFNSLKPCVHGSDAHCVQDLFAPAEDRQLWIRANPSFNGLAQLLLGPGERVFIGSEPPSLDRIRNFATKSIENIRFQRLGPSDPQAQWFSGMVPLNSGLVAVIGKKGSGKSAFADAIGLVGNAHSKGEFSFLTPQRFLNPKHRLGERFEAELGWRSGESETRRLDEEVDLLLPEKVKHIPQSYLERICAEIQDSSTPALFDTELESVIFSHVPKADRLGYEKLPDLVEHTTAEKEARIRLLRQRLKELNREYIALRQRGSAESKRTLTAQLAAKKAELEAHRKAKPAAVAEPVKTQADDPRISGVQGELSKVVARIEELDGKISELRKREEGVKKKRVAADRLVSRIDNLTESVEAFHEQSTDDVNVLGFDSRKLVSLQINTSDLRKLREGLKKEIAELADDLDRDRPGSLPHERREASEKAQGFRHRLTEPQRRHQEYLKALAGWTRRQSEIEGGTDDHTSLKGLEARLADLEHVPVEAEEKRKEREALVRDIFAAKNELLAEYRHLYQPVQEFIEESGVAREVEELSFSAAISVDSLEDGILAMIHHGKRGSFQGEQEGRERLRGLIGRHDFSSADGVIAFLGELGENLARDLRSDSAQSIDLAGQLVQAASPAKFYDFIFGLEYLRPRFELLWRGKPLEQLSPGERGTLLLIFYLLIDRDDVPLIIDQPEENLDNETVAELLVPAIKYAKERRQIVMVTHNPNLAVVCDADQVVHANIDKGDGNRIAYTSGAIEDPFITQLIVDVLEGTKPAFDLRDAKYDVLDRIAA